MQSPREHSNNDFWCDEIWHEGFWYDGMDLDECVERVVQDLHEGCQKASKSGIFDINMWFDFPADMIKEAIPIIERKIGDDFEIYASKRRGSTGIFIALA